MMLELRVVINTLLKDKYERVYYQQAPNDKAFPYLIFNFPNSFDNEDQEVFNFDIDVWDYSESSVNVEEISSELWRFFNRYHYLDDNMQFSVYRANRLPLEEEDKKFKRRKLIFELRYFDRRI